MTRVGSAGWRAAAFGVANLLRVVPAAGQPSPDPDARLEDEPLGKARTALDQGRHDEAIRLATSARAAGPASSRAEALELIGTAHVLAGRTDAGRKAFGELLEMAPAFELADPSAPAPVRAAFDAEAAPRRGKSRAIKFAPDATDATLFTVEVADGSAVARLLISCRESGRTAFSPVATTDAAPGKPRTIRLRSARAHGCIAVAYDRDDLPIGRAGTRARPVELLPRTPAAPPVAPAPAAADRPVMTRWWFWALVGGVAAAGALTIAVAAASSGPEPPAEKVGTAQGKLGIVF